MSGVSNLTVLVGGGILLALVGAIVYLADAHVVDGAAAITVLTTIVAAGVTALGVHSGVSAGAKAARGPGQQ